MSVGGESFVHLHVHSQFSLLQGAIPVDTLVEKVKALGMDSVAVTDTNNLFGAIEFYKAAKSAGIKPILGSEILYAPQGRGAALAANTDRAGVFVPRYHHLVLLCKNMQGYQNLCQIVSRAYTEAPPPQKGQASGPRALVDRELLDKYGDGLIVLSGCIRGELSYKILTGDNEGAIATVEWFKKRFGEDFYLELQDMGLPEQDQVNQVLFGFAEKFGIKTVATNDCHYLEHKHSESHEVLQCIEHGRELDFDRPKSLVPSEFCLKTPAEMRERFERFPGACDSTVEIAAKCDVKFKFKDDQGRPIYHLPNFRPEGVSREDAFDLIAFFREESKKGLLERFAEPSFREKVAAADWPQKEQEYYTRLDSELTMIERTGFAGYFLIVADFINWAKRQGIPVGPGRGSGAGSVVAYSLKITDIDPIEFNLLFERFINPERISMPDFDVDFCQERRGEVIEYVTKKYGSDRVSQIITFGKLQAKAALKDVSRVLGLSFAEADGITKLMPDELNISIQDALDREPRMREKMEQEPRTKKVVEYALELEGLYRNAGVHAAGVIITEHPLITICPLFVGKDGGIVTQFDKDSAEVVGLVKFDFLGLKTLTVIDHAVKLIRSGALPSSPKYEFEKNFKIEDISYRDKPVFELISRGDTDGVFQVESSGMKDLCTRIQPNSLEDLTAINALYRPGPLGSGMVDDFIDRKHGRKPIVYDVDSLSHILKDTYGVILYQEQVMQIARELAGYSLGQADLLRRAMGKKKAEEMAEHRSIFVKGATGLGLAANKAEGIFDLMAKFAEYGFNKSHSAAYGMITYQTAYLKTHYPAEFMAALMTTEMDNTDKITKYIGDAKAHGIPVLPPDVNASQKRFSVERLESKTHPETGESVEVKGIRFGLEAIKGVGGIAVDTILEARANGAFTGVLDFCKRVSTRKVNKKVMESLTLAGAMDPINETNRASLFASLETLLEYAHDDQAEKELGQSSLFDSFSAEDVKLVTPQSALFKSETDWPVSRKLILEKQTVGFYVSGHPMDTWQKICEDWLGWSTEKIVNFFTEAKERAKASSTPVAEENSWQRSRKPKMEVKLGGLLSEMREVMTKKGSRMAFAQFEDLKGKIEVIFFPEAYGNLKEMITQALQEAEALVITADLEIADEAPKLLVKNLEWAKEAHKGRVQQITFRLQPSQVTPDQLRELKKQMIHFRGKCPVRIEFNDPMFKTRLELPKTVGVAPTPQLVETVNRLFGRDVVQLG